jgi:hypothetical protein
MDFRYLEFLLTAYSWSAIILCVSLVLWLVRLPLTELNLLLFKVKVDLSQYMMDRIVVVIFIVCLQSMWTIQFRIKDEIDNLTHQQFESEIPFPATDGTTDDWLARAREQRAKEDARQAAIKKQWETLYDEITHSKNTAAFAFIRHDTETNQLIECDVQNVVWYIIMWVPPLFVAFWGYVVIKQVVYDSFGSGVIWWPVFGLAMGALLLWQWLGIIHNIYVEITRSVLEIAMLAYR